MSFFEQRYSGQNGGFSNMAKMFENATAVGVLIWANIIMFVLGMLFPALYEYLTLSFYALEHGRVWTLLTYSFMHGGFLHILCNMLGLYFMGRPVETWIGSGKFLILYFFGVLLGAAAWLLFELFTGEASMLGASAGVMAILSGFCIMYPPMPITFLLFFILPVRLMPMVMLKIIAAFEVFGLLMSLAGSAADIAYAAHLGGIAAGVIFVYLLRRGKIPSFGGMKVKFAKYVQKGKNVKRACEYKFKVNISPDDDTQIDSILEKINKKGFSSLTDEEREFLCRARQKRK